MSNLLFCLMSYLSFLYRSISLVSPTLYSNTLCALHAYAHKKTVYRVFLLSFVLFEYEFHASSTSLVTETAQ